MAYKIKWNDGGTTATAFSTKKLANNILKDSMKRNNFKGNIIPFKLGSETKSMTGYDIVWTEHKEKYGKIYHTRRPESLQSSEKVVKNWWRK